MTSFSLQFWTLVFTNWMLLFPLDKTGTHYIILPKSSRQVSNTQLIWLFPQLPLSEDNNQSSLYIFQTLSWTTEIKNRPEATHSWSIHLTSLETLLRRRFAETNNLDLRLPIRLTEMSFISQSRLSTKLSLFSWGDLMELWRSLTTHRFISKTLLQMVLSLTDNNQEASMCRIKMPFLSAFKLLRNSLFLRFSHIGLVVKPIKLRQHVKRFILEQDLLSMVLKLPLKTLLMKNRKNTQHLSNDHIWYLKHELIDNSMIFADFFSSEFFRNEKIIVKVQ